jgi:hypothetical protein
MGARIGTGRMLGVVFASALLALPGAASASAGGLWNVTLSGSGTDTSQFHETEYDIQGSCDIPMQQYNESTSFSFSFEWTHVRIPAKIVEDFNPRVSVHGRNTTTLTQGDCGPSSGGPGGTETCSFPLANTGGGTDAFVVSGVKVNVMAPIGSGPQQCSGDQLLLENFSASPGLGAYGGIGVNPFSLSRAQLARRRAIVKRVDLAGYSRVPLQGSCSGTNCSAEHCQTRLPNPPYMATCSYDANWTATLKFTPVGRR